MKDIIWPYCVMVGVLMMTLPFLYGAVDDRLTMERYDFNFVRNIDKKAEDGRTYDILPEHSYEIGLFYVKNYMPDDAEFSLVIECDEDRPKVCKDECQNISEKVCIHDSSIVVKTIGKKMVMGFEREQLLLDVAVRDDAPEGRYSLKLYAVSNKEVYSSKRFTVNVGNGYFSYDSQVQKGPANKTLYTATMYVGAVLAVLVLIIIFMMRRRDFT